jgi:hypothetical protein
MTLIALVLSAAASTNSPALAAGANQPRTYRVALSINGNEYENSQGDVLNDSRTQCPPAVNEPSLPARCWRWRGTHLGHGTYTRDAHFEPPDRFVATVTLTGRDESVLHLALEAQAIEDPTPPQVLGHVNRFPGTLTVIDGTGRFRGVTGTLTGAAKSTVVEVDAGTGIVHRKAGGTYTGKLTFPARRGGT